MRGLRLGLGLTGGITAFTPASLSPAAWYDPSDKSTLFQDTAGTTPVTAAGQTVALMRDKSGNGNHATMTTASARPVYQVDGAGHPYLLFDGTLSSMNAVFAIAQPWDRVSAVQQITWVSGRRIFSGGSTVSGCIFQNTSSPNLSLFDGATAMLVPDLAVGVNGVLTERHNGASSQLAVNNGAYATGSGGTTAAGGLTIGNDPAGGNAGNIRFYGAVMAPQLTDPNIAKLRTYLGAKCGLTL